MHSVNNWPIDMLTNLCEWGEVTLAEIKWMNGILDGYNHLLSFVYNNW